MNTQSVKNLEFVISEIGEVRNYLIPCKIVPDKMLFDLMGKELAEMAFESARLGLIKKLDRSLEILRTGKI